MRKIETNSNSIIRKLIILEMILVYLSLTNLFFFRLVQNYSIYFYLVSFTIILFLMKRIKVSRFIFIALFVFYLLVSILFNNGGIGSVTTYFVSILILEVLSKLDFTEKEENILRIFSLITVCLCFILSFKYRANYYYYMMHDINPNSIGQFSVYAFCYWCCTEKKSFKGKFKLFYLIMASLTVITQINCESRGSLVAIAFFIIYSFIPQKILTKRTLILITIIIIVIGISFPFIYLQLYYNGTIAKFLNKPLFTGREGIWINALRLFGNNTVNWLLGIGSKVIIWDAKTNVHNTYFGIIVNFGIIGLILYIIYISYYLLKAFEFVKKNTFVKRWIGVYIATVLVLGYTETSIFWAVIFIFSNYSIARAYKYSIKQEIENDT